jgi:SulP family sulfate permease
MLIVRFDRLKYGMSMYTLGACNQKSKTMNNHWFRSRLPALIWLPNYSRDWFFSDLTAGLVTAVLLIPQGMAYATLAGLPPEVGLYASILPPLLYAAFGTSRTLSVGPVSVAALLVANALASAGATQGEAAYLQDALLLAGMSGGILLLMALLRLDVLVNFLGHPVLSGFTSGAAVLIILSQLKNLTGMEVPQSGSGIQMMGYAVSQASSLHLLTTIVGIGSIGLLLALRSPLVRLLRTLGVAENKASIVSRGGPLGVIALLIVAVVTLGLHERGLDIVGASLRGFQSLLGSLSGRNARLPYYHRLCRERFGRKGVGLSPA